MLERSQGKRRDAEKEKTDRIKKNFDKEQPSNQHPLRRAKRKSFRTYSSLLGKGLKNREAERSRGKEGGVVPRMSLKKGQRQEKERKWKRLTSLTK